MTDVVEAQCREDERNYSELLWTAPELLRLCESVPEDATEKGDVYSFGILLQEILYRNTPFFFGEVSAIGKVVFCINVCIISSQTITRQYYTGPKLMLSIICVGMAEM